MPGAKLGDRLFPSLPPWRLLHDPKLPSHDAAFNSRSSDDALKLVGGEHRLPAKIVDPEKAPVSRFVAGDGPGASGVVR
jgi:hypothetical protein